MSARIITATTIALLSVAALSAETGDTWEDPSPHSARLVRVDEGVELEVLNWGGTGRDLVLLAGLGNTAHVFDDFAPELADQFRVLAVTRRGFGNSSKPAEGYDPGRLADDVVAVIDELALDRPIVVGHSVAGEELSSLGARNPIRVSALVYLDAITDRSDMTSETARKNGELYNRVIPQGPSQPPGPADLASMEAVSAWLATWQGYKTPLAEIRRYFDWDVNGSAIGSPPPDAASAAASAAMRGRFPGYNFSAINVPVLAIVAAAPMSGRDLPGFTTERAAEFDQVAANTRELKIRSNDALRAGIENSVIVEIQGAHHYIFLSNEKEVLEGIRSFASTLGAR